MLPPCWPRPTRDRGEPACEGLARKETNRAIQSEFLGDRLDERFIGDGPYSRQTLLRPLAEVARADRAGAGAGRHARRCGPVPGLLRSDGSGRRAPAAGRGQRPAGPRGRRHRPDVPGSGGPSGATAVDREPDRRPSHDRCRDGELFASNEDPLIALAHQHSDAAIDILGAALLGDLKGLRLVNAGTTQVHLEGRLDRATEICKLLGRTGNPRSVRWLTSADDLIARRPDLAEHFPRHESERGDAAVPRSGQGPHHRGAGDGKRGR